MPIEPLLSDESIVEQLDVPTTTLWDFPYQSPPGEQFGDPGFRGVTPSQVVRNLILQHTEKGDWVVDPMAGSGTAIDVARHLGRRAVGFDLCPRRLDVHLAEASKLPLPEGFASLVFLDPPYGDNLSYSDDHRCLGRLPSNSASFYLELSQVAEEVRRILRPGGVCAWLISDQLKGQSFTAVGFQLFSLLRRLFRPVDIVVVSRHHDRSMNPMWEHRARAGRFLLRGFKYLLILRKGGI